MVYTTGTSMQFFRRGFRLHLHMLIFFFATDDEDFLTSNAGIKINVLLNAINSSSL